ncbi:MAG: PhzF family phenazine biosynthesis protein [Candidatus Izimaplasma sp.]|nr:PhzF family phenazine biosynthesis protein [Candidatus Izimaplasma bacterium]
MSIIEEIYVLSAFIEQPGGGNKAGVVLHGEHLSDENMQAIAKELNYSETAFVLPSKKADFKVRFFSPESEVDLCGHATIATFNLLRDKHIISPGIYTQETKVGILQLNVKEQFVYMQQNLPIFGDSLPYDEIKNIFEEDDFVNESLPIRVVSTAMREIFVPIKSVKLMNLLTPDFAEITRLSKKYNTIGVHVFAFDEKENIYGRNFAPILGIDEESATGTSNGALSCYLFTHYKTQRQFDLRQGYSMNKPSLIKGKLLIKENEITGVWVGGTAKILQEKVIL